MRNLIYLFFAFLLSWSVYAKPLQGDSINGVAASENFMKQGDAEIVVSGVRTYNNGDVAEPTTCSGGTVTGLTVAREKSDDMGGSFYWKITKSAGTQRGKGVAFDFTIDKFTSNNQVQQELKLRLSQITGVFNFGTASTLSDLGVYIYDRDKSKRVIVSQHSNIEAPLLFNKVFSPENGSRNFTLCLHVQTTNANAITIGVKNLISSEWKGGVVAGSENTFVATLLTNGTVEEGSEKPYKWISSVTLSGSFEYIVTPIGLDINKLKCQVTAATSGGAPHHTRAFVLTNQLYFTSTGGGGSQVRANANISCTRTGDDYKPPQVMATSDLADNTGTSFYTRSAQCPVGSVKEGDTITRAQYPRLFEVWGLAGDTYKLDDAGLFHRASGTTTIGAKTYTVANGERKADQFESHYHNYAGDTSYSPNPPLGTNASVPADTWLNRSIKSTSSAGTGNETHGAFVGRTMCWWAVPQPTTLGVMLPRGDDIRNEEWATGGWDYVSNKPIYKRCHKVVSDITANNTTIVTWPTNLHPVNIMPASTTDNEWVLGGGNNVDGSKFASIFYVKSSGIVKTFISGTGTKVSAGTTICMEYVRP